MDQHQATAAGAAPPSASRPAGRPHRVLAFGRGDMGAGPYNVRFYDALEALGHEAHEARPSGGWLLRRARSYDAVHLHWPSLLYARPTRAASLRAFATFVAALEAMRRAGTHLLWTVHNIMPHERCVVPALDVLMRRYLVRVASRFFVHGPNCEAEALAAFPAMAGRVSRIAFGHWTGAFPDAITREAARARLGLAPGDFAFLFAGQCRPYKNIEGLVRAVASLPAPARLVVAGRFVDPALERAVRAAAAEAGEGRVVLHARYIPDDEMQVYLRGCDAVAAAYTEVLTSGTTVLAGTFGRPIVAPARGFLKDFTTPETAVLYDPADPDGLRGALLRAMGTRFDEARIAAHARSHTWEDSARAFVSALPPPRADLRPVPAGG